MTDTYSREQREMAIEDAAVVMRLAAQLQAETASGNPRAVQLARSIAGVSMALAARLDHSAGYLAGLAAGRAEDRSQLRRVTPMELRRLRVLEQAGGEVWEYPLNGEWLTVAEIVARDGVNKSTVYSRLRRTACTNKQEMTQ